MYSGITDERKSERRIRDDRLIERANFQGLIKKQEPRVSTYV